MKKLSQTYFKQVQTKPSRTQSPDFRAGNSIRPTKSPQNIEYILKQNDRHRTPVKAWETPTKNEQHRTVTSTSRYFINNRTASDNRSQFHNTIPSDEANRNYCQLCSSGHCHCSNNEEVVIQLKKIITMINGAAVPPFQPSGEDMARQVEILKTQNARLLDLVEKYKIKSESRVQSTHGYESQVKILRQQLGQNIAEHEKQREQLYRTNKTLSSQYKSIEDKYLSCEKELERLRQLMKIKQEEYQIDQDSRKKGQGQERLSLSMIKEQYSTSIKTLKDNIQFEVDNQIRDYEAQIREYRMRIDNLEERVRACEKVNNINRVLNEENKNLMRKLSQKGSSVIQNQTNQQTKMLQKQNYDLKESIKLLNTQISQTKYKYELQITQLKNKNGQIQQKLVKDTEARVKKLMENYEQEIKILKNDAKSKTCNHKGIQQEVDMLKQQNEQNWQEVVKLRNQLAKYTAQNTQLQNQIKGHKNEISKLNHQISNDQLNLTARTTLLENENAKLRSELEGKLSVSKSLAILEDQNSRLKQELALKSSSITNLTALEYERQELRHDLENSRLKCQQLEQQNNRKFYEMDKMNSDHNKRQHELRHTLKAQLEQTKDLYENQIVQLQEEYKRLQDQYDSLKIQISRLQLELENSQHLGNRDKDEKIYQHELTIRNLSKIIEETEGKIGQLEDNLRKRVDENRKLTMDIRQIEEMSQRRLRENNQSWQKELQLVKMRQDSQISRLKNQLTQRQMEERNSVMKIKTKITAFSTEGLKSQLLELKKLVDQARFEKLEEQLSKISQNYERQLIRSQQKTMQIDGLTKDKCALQDKIGDLQRMRLMLQQKINILEGNIKIIENQLKQRKSLCDSLLNQKVILQKQNLMLKKVKIDKQSIEATKAKARQISNKIDKLLAMEEQRQHNIMQVSKTYSQMVVESKTKRI